MSQFHRLAAISLSGYAALFPLTACSDGAADDVDPGGRSVGSSSGTGGSALGTAGSTLDSAGSSGSIPSGTAGQAQGGAVTQGGATASGAAGQSAGGVGMGGLAAGGTGHTGGGGSGGSGQPCSNDGDIRCGASCVDPQSSEQHCGSCGTKCGSDQTCQAGKCSGGTSSGTSCSNITDYGVVPATIVVKSGETHDGQCRRYRADPEKLGDGSQDEGQQPVFVVENGGKLSNVVLGAPAADGIHTKGNVTLENITWEDIGEDALTIKESGTVILNGGSAKDGSDKVFQINAASTFRVSNFKASNAGKFIRQNGGTTFKVQVFIDECDISDMDEAIFRTDSSSSTVSMTNTRYHAIGDELFIGVSAGNITQSNNTQY